MRHKKPRRPIRTIALVLLLLFVGLALWQYWRIMEYRSAKGMPVDLHRRWVKEQKHAIVNPGIIGNLGGAPVRIPARVAVFPDYEGDPAFMEKRTKPREKITFESKIMGFGMELHYPDMTSANVPEAAQFKGERRAQRKWLVILVDNAIRGPDRTNDKSRAITAPNYFLKEALDPENYVRYELQEEPIEGLTEYRAVGTKLHGKFRLPGEKGRPMGYGSHEHSLLFDFDEQGHARSVIKCGNESSEFRRCSQFFIINEPISIQFKISYNRAALLPQWRQVQAAVTQYVLDFRVSPEEAAAY